MSQTSTDLTPQQIAAKKAVVDAQKQLDLANLAAAKAQIKQGKNPKEYLSQLLAVVGFTPDNESGYDIYLDNKTGSLWVKYRRGENGQPGKDLRRLALSLVEYFPKEVAGVTMSDILETSLESKMPHLAHVIAEKYLTAIVFGQKGKKVLLVNWVG